MKACLKIGAVFFLVAVLLIFIRYAVQEYQIASHLEYAEEAMQQGNLAQVWSNLQFLEALEVERPELTLLRAEYYSIVAPSQALGYWSSILKQESSTVMHRRAYVMTALKAKDIARARDLISNWPEAQRDTEDYHQAALAVSFAQGLKQEVVFHIDRLIQLNPSSEVHQINAIRIQAFESDSDRRAEARLELQQWLEKPQWQEFALHSLIQSLVLDSDATSLDRLTQDWVTQFASPTTEMILMMLDARDRMGLATAPQDLDLYLGRAWTAAGQEPYRQSRILGWLLHAGEIELAKSYIGQINPHLKWVYPLGLPVAEYYINIGKADSVLAELQRHDWGQKHLLKMFLLAFAADTSPAATIFLDQSIQSATASYDALARLERIALRWQWRAGRLRVLRALLLHPESSDAYRKKIWQEMENMGDTQGMFLASVACLESDSKNPALLNNVAYLGLLLNENPQKMLTWAIQAKEASSSKSVNIESTLMFAQIKANQEITTSSDMLQQMQSSTHPGVRLIYAAGLRAQNQPISVTMKQWLANQTYSLPEETVIQQELTTVR